MLNPVFEEHKKVETSELENSLPEHFVINNDFEFLRSDKDQDAVKLSDLGLNEIKNEDIGNFD
jgi:hypothetical protein